MAAGIIFYTGRGSSFTDLQAAGYFNDDRYRIYFRCPLVYCGIKL